MRGSKPEPFSHEVQIVTNKQDKNISDKMHWKHTAQYGQLIVSRNKLTDKLGSPYKAPHGYRKYDDVGRENGSCVANCLWLAFIQSMKKPMTLHQNLLTWKSSMTKEWIISIVERSSSKCR